DQLLITYRLNTRKLQNFVALEDSLPAGVEVVNPNLALVGKFYQLPPVDPKDRFLGLSYSEMRDRAALLYFDTVDPGSGTYSIPDELQKSPSGTLTLLDWRGREIAELASPEARTQFPVSLEQMGPWLPRVTVALEDRRFYKHRGIDWRATLAACARNLRLGHIVSGASTITQQLVKLTS